MVDKTSIDVYNSSEQDENQFLNKCLNRSGHKSHNVTSFIQKTPERKINPVKHIKTIRTVKERSASKLDSPKIVKAKLDL